MELTKSQKEALTLLNNFINSTQIQEESDSSNVFILSGPAGTGKTTLMSEFLKQFPSNTVSLSTPTHKAKKILKEKTNNKYQTQTIHQLFDLKPFYTDTGKILFVSPESITVSLSKYKIFIIDECSMISEDLFKILNNYILSSDKQTQRFIFIGDPYQLPPVNEEISKVFTTYHTNNTTNSDSTTTTTTTNYYELKEIVRNKGSVQQLTNYIRDRIFNPDFTFTYSKETKKLFDTKYTIPITHTSYWINAIEDTFSKTVTSAHHITWTNKETNQINTIIRNKLYPNSSSPYIKGETIIAAGYLNSNIKNLSYPTEVIEPIQYYTCDEFNIQDVQLANVTYKLDTLAINTTIKCWKLLINATTRVNIDGEEEFLQECLYKIIDTSDEHDKFTNIQNLIKANCKKLGSVYKQDRSPANKSALIKMWGEYHKFTNKFNPPIIYNYSTTTHKSQGSTYRYTFVNVRDINKNRDSVYRNKCLYTAVTRASYKLILFI